MLTYELKQDGVVVAMGTVPAKNFSTGSRGFYASLKIPMGNLNYQSAISLVEIGSKPNPQAAADAATKAAAISKLRK